MCLLPPLCIANRAYAHADGVIVQADGAIAHTDGAIAQADGQTDKASAYADGASAHADRAAVQADGASTRADGQTVEYGDFLEARKSAGPVSMRDSFGKYRFRLNDGRLIIIGTDNTEIWRSNDGWYVDSFRIGDVNSDNVPDVAFTVWKSYSYGPEHPARMENNDASVRCHLFVYSFKDNRVKPLWCSSNLPRPIYSFELCADGIQTPALSGVRIVTREGAYTDDYSKTAAADYIYEWNSWGFSPPAPRPWDEEAAVSNHTPAVETRQNSDGEADPLHTPEAATYYAALAAVGDIMCHEAQYRDAFNRGGGTSYDFSGMFRYIAPHISAADYAFGNLETTIIQDGGNPTGYPAFGSPASFAEAVKAAGFDLVTTANNHALDYGKSGLLRTIQVLDKIGLEHTGTYATEEDSQKILIVSVNEITFAILSYTYGTNGIPTPRDMPWCVNKLDKIKGDVVRAKDLNPDFIIVLPHMGAEYETFTREQYKKEVFGLFEAGADIVLSSHPHVLQPVEFLSVTTDDGAERKCFAAYSMGNFISSQRAAPRDYGMIITMNFSKTGDSATLDSVVLTPTWVKYRSRDGSYDITVLPVNELDKPEFSDVIENLSRNDVRRIENVKREFVKMYPEYR